MNKVQWKLPLNRDWKIWLTLWKTNPALTFCDNSLTTMDFLISRKSNKDATLTEYCDNTQWTMHHIMTDDDSRGMQLPNLSGNSEMRSSLILSFRGPRMMTGRVYFTATQQQAQVKATIGREAVKQELNTNTTYCCTLWTPCVYTAMLHHHALFWLHGGSPAVNNSSSQPTHMRDEGCSYNLSKLSVTETRVTNQWT